MSAISPFGLTVVFTNGTYDIFHAGHVRLLKFCKEQGDYLVVGLNSDASVKRLKGPDRPFNTQEDRAEIVRAISYVDEVIIFEEDTPYELIKQINPDIIVKGGDYKAEEVVGHDLAEVRIFPYIIGHSTTNLAKKILSL
jgi:D-beta-D-heptose 7-phosphate kinase/D-beta-D-heptose 1-phosphate adenosyltransferase